MLISINWSRTCDCIYVFTFLIKATSFSSGILFNMLLKARKYFPLGQEINGSLPGDGACVRELEFSARPKVI